MSHTTYDHFEDFDDLTALPSIRNLPAMNQPVASHPKRKAKGRSASQAQLALPAERQEDFNFSYKASLHEGEWIDHSLGGFYDQHWLDDVLRLVQGGKEAHVYQCQANPSVPGLDKPFLAAKVYRPRRFRNLKNDARYRQDRDHLDADGNTILDHGMLNAMSKRSAWGQELLHTSWIEHEVKTMQILHAAGADVPLYLASGNNAILMSYIGDEHSPAPMLNSLELDSKEAHSLFQRLLHNIEIMLANRRVHGDLSAYNILYWQGNITLIDFPQAVDPRSNRDAYAIFKRDLTRACDYFSRQGVRSNPVKLAQSLWLAYGHRLSPEVHPALLDPEDHHDRDYWKKVKGKV